MLAPAVSRHDPNLTGLGECTAFRAQNLTNRIFASRAAVPAATIDTEGVTDAPSADEAK